jgi:hypothetical protein
MGALFLSQTAWLAMALAIADAIAEPSPSWPLPAGFRRIDFIHWRRNPRTAPPPRPENIAVRAVLF